MKTVRNLSIMLAACVTSAFAAGPVFDASGNGQLSGTYYFRQVLYVGASDGSISQAVTYYGNIAFSGATAGTYTVSGGTLVVSGSNPQTFAATGTYSVSASGYGFMSSPLASLFPTGINGNVYFLVSGGILVGSETESGYNDMIVAAPFSSNLSAASFSGSYTISSFFPGSTPSSSLGATYQLNPNGALSLGTVSISGYSGGGTAVTQSSAGVKYAFSNGAYTVSFPTNNSANFYAGGTNGIIFLYSSPDSNFVFGGTAFGFDMFVGVKNVAGGTNTPLSGLYYEAGIDDTVANGLDTYYGSFNTSKGVLIGHQRLLTAGFAPEGLTYSANYPTNISGTYTDGSGTVNYTLSASGIRIGYGNMGYLGLEVGLPYTSPAVSKSVYLDPTGIVNTASSAPFTAGVSPGDFITIYGGTNLAAKTVFAPPGAFPTTLGGVTVVIDGAINAPLYYVSPTQISFLVPYQVNTFPVVSIQVNNNGVTSNIATTFVNLTTPGVFTYATGIGDSALLDFPASGKPFYFVSAAKPALPGDVVVAYLTGLGVPFPSNGDGALGVADTLIQSISIDVAGVPAATPAYAGLAPGLAGLYQVNFTVPTGPLCTSTSTTACIAVGDNALGITGPDSYTAEALIPIGAATSSSAVSASTSPEAKPGSRSRLLPRLSKAAVR